MKQKEKSTIGWLAEFAGTHKKEYIKSVVYAVCGVICSLLPYFIIGSLVTNLIAGNRDWDFYLKEGTWMAAFWLARVLFHALSTSCSHIATFAVLGNIRKRLCDKLARVPLGKVKEASSGSLKNIIVERVDSIETTLAHVLSEFTSNLLAPICVFVYL